MENLFTTSVSGFKEIVSMFMQPPMIYFVGVTLFGSVVGVAKYLVPMRRR